MFWKGWKDGAFSETDFQWIQEFGFNFVRLPLDYRIWTDPKTQKIQNEDALKRIDAAVKLGQKYKIHVCISLHHAPGYTAGDEPDGRNLWQDSDTQAAFVEQWKMFARRFRGLSPRALSFNLLNEPSKVDSVTYERIIRRTAQAIWEIDPERLLVIDGLNWGKTPVLELADLPVIQANRGYEPAFINHWSQKDGTPSPKWPTFDSKTSTRFDRAWLYSRNVLPWRPLKDRGVPVIIGEFGTHSQTPHSAVLAWMEDQLKNWRDEGWGWALWDFSGEFGIFDSGRKDVQYENFRGRSLDRAMLALLQNY
jgi:endoglucanase